MSSYIKEECRRVFLSKVTIATALLAIVLTFAGMAGYLTPAWIGNVSFMYLFVSGYNEGISNYLGLLFPIIVALPFATSYISDCKAGIHKYFFIRIDRNKYMVIKFLMNAIVGGGVLVIGPLVATLFLLTLKLFTGIPMMKEQIETVQYFQSIGIQSPYLMLLIILGTLFFCGSVFATFTLGLSIIIQNVYVTMIAPFAYLIISGTVLVNIHTNLYAVGLYDVNHFGMSFVWRFLYGAVLFLIGATVFFVGGRILEKKYV